MANALPLCYRCHLCIVQLRDHCKIWLTYWYWLLKKVLVFYPTSLPFRIHLLEPYTVYSLFICCFIKQPNKKIQIPLLPTHAHCYNIIRNYIRSENAPTYISLLNQYLITNGNRFEHGKGSNYISPTRMNKKQKILSDTNLNKAIC